MAMKNDFAAVDGAKILCVDNCSDLTTERRILQLDGQRDRLIGDLLQGMADRDVRIRGFQRPGVFIVQKPTHAVIAGG
ncbi:hypothetical protein CSPX01_00663 [Colletotrichum filicis]|nr:hypothetical protein CSPX01_00663 [Colletotrichum filicis]